MIELCDTMLAFYPREIAKIDARIERFRKIREAWEQRPEQRGRDLIRWRLGVQRLAGFAGDFLWRPIRRAPAEQTRQ